ncbi:MAG: InlB B-repeat-containing protein, partial [Spirochaetales bacterium]|nr:InlB B-repeat-containing protein [Spirochaetales bacterium]
LITNAQPNDILDCSQYKITDYNATVDKKLTIQNANMQGDTLNVTAEGVVLTNLAKVSVNTNASLKISGSLLSSLSIGNVTNGRGELLYSLNNGRGDDQAVVVELEGATVVRDADLDLAGASIKTDSSADIENIEVKKSGAIKGNAANIRIAGSKIKLEVTDLSADNVTFVGNNMTLCVMDRTSCIMNVETDEDVVCQLEMEDGPYANMSNPTVRGKNGKLTSVDNSNESILSKITLELANLEKVAYSVGEVVNLTGLEIFDTYNRDGVVEFTQEFPQGVKVPTHTRRETAPLDNPEYSFSINGANAIGYTFKESDKGQVDKTITKTEGKISVSTVLKVTVLKDDELAISYVGAEAEQLADLPKVFKKSQNVVIPTNMTKDGFVFAGWYENNNIGPITGWEANTKEGSVSLYARWINMLYVDPDVTNDTGTGAYNMPFKMIEQAIGAITSTGSYTIVLMKDIDQGYGKIDFKQNFPIKITIQPEIGTVSINEYEYLMFGNNIDLTLKNISFSGEIDAANSKSLSLENVNIGNNIRCGQASFTNVTTLGNVFCTNAVFTDVTID